VVYAEAGYQGIAKRPAMAGKSTECQATSALGVSGGHVSRLAAGATRYPRWQAAGSGCILEAHIRARGEYPFRVIKQQFGFQKSRLRGMVKNRSKVNVLAALTNVFLALRQLLATP